MSDKHYSNITLDAVKLYCTGTVSDFTEERLLDILNGEVDLDDARDDVLSFMDTLHNVYCSSCGGAFKTKEKTGFSHCIDHDGVSRHD